MDSGQSLYFLRELILRFQQSSSGAGDRALCEHGKVALHTLFELLNMPAPTPETIQGWREYADQIKKQHEPVSAAYNTGYSAPARPSNTPYEAYTKVADQIVGLCAGMINQEIDVEYANKLAEKATNMKDWMVKAQRVTPKMEAALTNMLDGVNYRLNNPKKAKRESDEEYPVVGESYADGTPF